MTVLNYCGTSLSKPLVKDDSLHKRLVSFIEKDQHMAELKIKVSDTADLWPYLLQICQRRLLMHSAEKFMHRKYFAELSYSYSLTKSSLWLDSGETHMGLIEMKKMFRLHG